jgi:hypothetical protein
MLRCLDLPSASEEPVAEPGPLTPRAVFMITEPKE